MSALQDTLHRSIKAEKQLKKNSSASAKKAAPKMLSPKEIFQKKHGLYEDKNHFLVAITTPLFDENNAEVWSDLLPGISDMGFQMVLRANASHEYKNIMEAFVEDHIGLCTLIPENEYQEVFEAADILVTFSADEETVHSVNQGLAKGVIPIVPTDFPHTNIENYNPNLETGNAFVYHKKSVWSVFAAIIRAYENYRFPYDWKNIAKSAIESMKK
jgi:glycogen synthase